MRLANPLSTEEPSYTTTLLPGLLRAAARNLGRGAPGVALFETGTVAFPVDRGPAPIYGVDWRPSDDELAKLFEALPEQPLHLAVVLAGERERAGWWGAGRDGGLVRRDRPGPPARRRARGRRRGDLGQPDALAPRPLRRRSRRRTAPSSATPASCTRRSARRSGCRPASAAVEIDLDVLMARAVDVVPGPEFSTYPVAKEDVALVVADDVTGGARSRRRCARARGSTSSRSGSSTSTPATRSGPATGRWPSRCGSGRPTGP